MIGDKLRAASKTVVAEGWDLSTAVYNDQYGVRVVAQDTNPTGVFFKPDGTKMYVIGSANDRVNEYNLSTAWDITSAVFSQFFSVSAQDTTPSGLFFKDDGTKMYFVGLTFDSVYEYTLSTAWDISTASYIQSFSVATQETLPTDVFFKSDGTKMYVIGQNGVDVTEYTLSTAWNISTATAYVPSFSVSAQETSPQSIFFKPDGTKMYVIGGTGDDVNEYNLSIPWYVSSATYVQVKSISAQETTPTGLFFKSDGTKMYVIGTSGDDVNEYDLSTAWNVSTATYKQAVLINTQDTLPQAVFFKEDGLQMYVLGQSNDSVHQYSLSTAWNVSTRTFVRSFSVGSQESTPTALFFKPDGTQMYVLGTTGDDVNIYNLSTAWNIGSAVYSAAFIVSGQSTAPTGLFFSSNGRKMYVIGTAPTPSVFEYNLTIAWDVTTAAYNTGFRVNLQETGPTGVFFKPDGTKMYVIGTTGDDVNEYDLSTAWDIYSSTYVQNFSVVNQESVPESVFFKPDGTKMYVTGGASDAVYEYNLSTAWDLSTATFVAPETNYFSVAAQANDPTGIFFKPDGTKMYVIGDTNDSVHEYNLSTAWDVTSSSFLQSLNVNAQDNTPSDLFFKPDGTKMYMVGQLRDNVNEYDLSTAWDISTATIESTTFSVAAQETNPQGIFFKPDGTKMYVIGVSGDDVNEYNLSTAWDVSTASFFQLFSVAAQDATPTGLFFKSDGTKMYVIGQTGDDVNEYSLSTAWDVSTASYVQVFSVALEEVTPSDLFFKPDGTKMYVIGVSGDDVNEYNLSTAWDVSTASFFQLFSVAAQDAAPQGLFFKPDGTKMYITGIGQDVNEYNLSTAWDVSTATFIQVFSVAAQESSPQSVFFKPDGTKMYVIGTTNDRVNEYNLSTAWDVSTAVYFKGYSLTPQDTTPAGVFFKPDGTKMYMVGAINDRVFEYNLSTAWSTPTASFVQAFSVLSQEAAPQSVFFKPDGTKMFVLGSTGDDINEYTLSTAWNISTASYVQNFSVANQELVPEGMFFRPDGKKIYIVGQGSAVFSYDL